MNKYLIAVSAVIFSLLFIFSCKKYPEGGRIKKAEKNLGGGLNDEYMKQWSVSLYEVDGVDSTKLWKQGKSTDRFSYYHVQISRGGDGNLGIATEVLELSGSLLQDNDILKISADGQSLEGINCYRTKICERNIFLPEGENSANWKLLQVDENNVKMTYSNRRQYTIMLAYADEE